MTKQELNLKIAYLKALTEHLEEPDKTFKLNEIALISMDIDAMALDELVNKLAQISLTDAETMDEEILAARCAMDNQQKLIKAVDFGIKLIKTALDIIL